MIERVTELGDNAEPALEPLYNDAIRDTIERFEATGSPVIRSRVLGTALASEKINGRQ